MFKSYEIKPDLVLSMRIIIFSFHTIFYFLLLSDADVCLISALQTKIESVMYLLVGLHW